MIFWIGLIILGLASVELFGVLWMIAIWDGYGSWIRMVKQTVPLIVGGAVFILIGLYMMKSGAGRSGEED